MNRFLLAYVAKGKLVSTLVFLFEAASCGLATHLETSESVFRGRMDHSSWFGPRQTRGCRAIALLPNKEVLQLREEMPQFLLM